LQREVEVQTLSPAHKVVAFAPDGSWVVTGSLDNALTFWALPSGRLIKKIPDIAWAFTMSPDGRWLASTGFLRDFKVWDIGSVAQWSKNHSDPNVLFSWNSTSRRSEHRFKGHREFVSDVAFSPDSRTVVSGSWDGDLKLWDPASGREIRTLSGHTSGIVRVAFSPDGKHIFSGAWDGTIRVWDAATGEQSVSLSAGRGSEDWLAIAPDGLFDGTSDAMQQVAWKMSGTSQSVPLDAFFTDFYHPGLLAEILANNRPRAQFDIATEIQVPGLRLMLRQKLAHLENRSSGIAVCFDQTPGTAIDVGPTDQRIFFPPVNGYGPGTTSTCKFEKLLPTSIANSNTLTAQLLKPNSDVFTTPWDGRLSATSGSTLHVLTVAVSQYPSISGFDRLPYAVPSARALEEFFRAQQVKGTKPYAMVRVWNSLLDQDATRGSIKQTLSLMAKEVKEDDVVLLYLAGHGQMSLQEEMFYFVPVDGQTGKLRSTAVSTAMIAQALRDMPARRMVLIVDACQAGGAIEALSKVGVVKAQAEQRGLQLAQNPAGHEQGIGVHLIAATLPLSYAIGLRDGRSVLATTLLEGLESPSRTFTAAQLSTYIREHLPVISERAMHGFRQVPLTVAIGLDFPLALAQKAADAQPRQSLGPQNSPRTAGPVTQMNQNSGAGPISPATGYLTIRSHSPDTAIQVTTLGQFYGDWIDHPCAPGTYVVIASREGMRTEQRTVVVEASKHVAIDFHLSSDSAAALANNLSGQTIGAPTVTPDSSGATTSSEVVSSSYLSAGGYTEFQKAANQALRKGGTVTIDLVHEHVGAAGDSIHPVTLTLTARTLTYLPGTSSCKYSTFTVPLEKIETIEVTNKVVEGKIIGIVVRHLAAGTFLLHLQLRDPARSNERINLFLATPDSQIVKYPNNVKYLASPEQSSKTLDSLADLMRNTRATITWK